MLPGRRRATVAGTFLGQSRGMFAARGRGSESDTLRKWQLYASEAGDVISPATAGRDLPGARAVALAAAPPLATDPWPRACQPSRRLVRQKLQHVSR